MIKRLSSKDIAAIYHIINLAASAYKGFIPDDCYHEPYMPEEELRHEMENMTFFGWEEMGKLVGVMGFQPIKDVTLIRHAYVLPDYQRRGIESRLLDYLKQMTKSSHLLVGTWADATWAISFYTKHGFKLMPNKDELLRKYWDIPLRQIETSVVLSIEL
jgi:GNAT superfamily N-acetyltransferase